MKKAFPDIYIGYSDHTKPDICYDVVKTAYLLGANVVEKHFTVDKSLVGNDHYHAMDPKDAEKILAGIDFLEQLKGSADIACLETEKIARQNARRSIVAARNIPAGVKITKDMLSFKRPGTGISPKDINLVLGKITKHEIEEDTAVQFGDVNEE